MVITKERALLGGLLLLLVTTAAASYYRYVVTVDFLVTYEIDCDPEVETCYIGCEDDECEVLYYYAEVERDAGWLRTQCGVDITDCLTAEMCTETEDWCMIYFCDPTETPGDCAGPNL